MTVNFNLRRLPDRVLDLIVTATGNEGWLARELVEEQDRRLKGREPRTLEIPALDHATMKLEYAECGRCLIGVESRQLELEVAGLEDEAHDLAIAAELFYEIMQSLKRRSQN